MQTGRADGSGELCSWVRMMTSRATAYVHGWSEMLVCLHLHVHKLEANAKDCIASFLVPLPLFWSHCLFSGSNDDAFSQLQNRANMVFLFYKQARVERVEAIRLCTSV
jgi:hypothetical protein